MRKNIRSDITIIEHFYDYNGANESVPALVPSSVRIEYFTVGSMWRKWICSRNGDNYQNCSLSADGKSLICNVALSRMFLGEGPLLKVVRSSVEDAAFPESTRNTEWMASTGIDLWKGPSDAGELESESVLSDVILRYGYSAYRLAVLNGFVGTEEQWLASLVGPQGDSAYQVAVQQGFVGTKDEWIASLVGPQGLSAYQVAVVDGFDGTVSQWLASLVGPQGKSAYQVAVDNGYEGTEVQWLASLVGPAGDSAYAIAVQQGFVGTKDEWLASLIGPQGKSAYQVAVDEGFEGTVTQWLASLVGPQGVSIASVVQTTESQESGGENVITVTLSNGQTATFSVRNGAQGIQGIQGVPGVANAKYKQVAELPEAGAGTMDYIYLTPSETSGVYNMSYTEEDGNTYIWRDLGTTAIQLSDYATREEFDALSLDAARLTKEVDGVNKTGTHIFNAAATYYYWEGLNIPAGSKFVIKISGTASWDGTKAWLVSNLSAVAPGLGGVLPNGTYEITAPGDITKIGLRIFTLDTAGDVRLDFKIKNVTEDYVGLLDYLHTTDKDDIVDAINEVHDDLPKVDGVLNLTAAVPLAAGQYYQLTDPDGSNYVPTALWNAGCRTAGIVVKFQTAQYEWAVYQFTGNNTGISNFKTIARWVRISEFGAIGKDEVYNLSLNVPLVSGYYQFANADGENYAPTAMWNRLGQGKARAGFLAKICTAQFKWEVYMFTGQDVNSGSWNTASRWVRLATMDDIPETFRERMDLSNVENLLVVGQSHAMGVGAIKNKSWLSYLSALTDWDVVNCASNGQNYIKTLSMLLTDSATDAGAKFSDANKGGVCLDFLGGNAENAFMDYGVDGKWAESNMLRLYSTLRSMGYEIIPGTAFGDQGHSISAVQAMVAKQLGLQMVDVNNEAAKLSQKAFLPFWYNAHFGTRTNAVQVASVLKSLKLRRPKKSIKIFRNRVSVTSNAELLYGNLYERVRFWDELSINQRPLADSDNKYVDRLDKVVADSRSIPVLTSEYTAFKAGTAVSITDKGLVEFILPVTAAGLSNAKFFIVKSSGTPTIYVRKYIDASLVVPTSPALAVMTIQGGVSGISLGDEFTSDLYTGVTFTVEDIVSDTGVIFCSADGSYTPQGLYSHTLTRVSDSETFTALNLNNSVPEGYLDEAAKPFGKWESVTPGSDGSIVLTDVSKYMDFDKVSFLVDGACSISDVHVEYDTPTIPKEDKPFFDYRSADDTSIEGTPVLTSTFVSGSMAGTLENNSGNATYDDDVETVDGSQLPQIPAYYSNKGATTVLRLMAGDKVKFEVNEFLRASHPSDAVTHFQVRLVCRYYPAPNLDITAQSFTITPQTFDFGRIGLTFGINKASYNSRYTREVYAPASFVELVEDVYFDGYSLKTFEITALDDNIELLYLEVV